MPTDPTYPKATSFFVLGGEVEYSENFDCKVRKGVNLIPAPNISGSNTQCHLLP